MTEDTMTKVNKERVRLVRAAIEDWPVFVLHISRRLSAAADSFRLGEDVRAVKLLRAGVDDLGSFMAWLGEIRGVVEDCGRCSPDADRLRGRLSDGARLVREAVTRSDFADAADRIETALVNELMGTGELADHLCADLAEIQEAA
jgi:hypothetical protein